MLSNIVQLTPRPYTVGDFASCTFSFVCRSSQRRVLQVLLVVNTIFIVCVNSFKVHKKNGVASKTHALFYAFTHKKFTCGFFLKKKVFFIVVITALTMRKKKREKKYMENGKKIQVFSLWVFSLLFILIKT